MRCVFTHQWAINIKSRYAYRSCKRCGLTQRGLYDGLYQDIVWEAIRERTFVRSQQAHIVRRPLSRLDQIAHSLRLRRTRATDHRDDKNARR